MMTTSLITCVVLLFVCTDAKPMMDALFVGTHEAVTRTDVIDDSVSDNEYTTLSSDDFYRAENIEQVDLRELGFEVPDDPLTSAGKSEGDIAISDLQRFVKESNQVARNAVRLRYRLWPDGRIPYVLSSKYGPYSRSIIAKAMKRFQEETCIEFVPKTSYDDDYLRIIPDDGCYSLVGRTGGSQPLSLTAGCIDTGTIVHELMHTVGFFHEQSRADRDDWIDIKWDNVMYGARDQFEKYSLYTITHLDEGYDYGSIMHYSPYAFSRNGRRTIVALKSGGSAMGQRRDFSSTDVRKINKLYKCSSSGGSQPIVPVTDSPVTAAPKCTDKASAARCVIWSFLGYCSRRKDVRAQCPKTCGACDEQQQQTTTPKPTTTTTRRTTTTTKRVVVVRPTSAPDTDDSNSNCKDKNPSCARWADMEYCNSGGYAVFMRVTCARSCGYCDPEQIEVVEVVTKDTNSGGKISKQDCRDESSMCMLAEWSGLCQPDKITKFVSKNCKKTCDLAC